MIKTVIVEDDAATAATIEKYIGKYFAASGAAADVVRFGDAREFLREYTAADVVFMDIDLPGLNGMEAVRELRKKDAEVTVIFVTNLAQYAVSGYEVSAFDFIVKPIAYGSFAMKLRRLMQYLAARRQCEIGVVTRHGTVAVRADEIKYVEIMRHVVTYHTVRGDFVGGGTLKNVMSMLDELPFVLCNRCYLVNLRYVTQIVRNEVCVGGDMLQISAPRRKSFLDRFNEYLGAGGKVR